MNEKTFDESKFIVINKKRFAEMGVEEGAMAYQMLSNAIASFEHDYEKITGKQMKQKYIVCNADEPYAERVKAIILGTEEARDAAIRQAAMEEATPKWISVKERLPEDGQSVAFIEEVSITKQQYPGIEVEPRILGGRFIGGRHNGEGGFPEFCTPGYGTAASYWMPLPEPPKEAAQ